MCIRDRAEGVYTVVREPAEVELDTEYRLRHDVYLLEEAYNALQGLSLIHIFSIIVTRLLYYKDIRTFGSGNAGICLLYTYRCV